MPSTIGTIRNLVRLTPWVAIIGLVLLDGALSPALRAESGEIQIVWGVKIPMRDGVNLNGTMYRPSGVSKQKPVVFSITPYIADTYHAHALSIAKKGFIFILIDARGRGNSGGRWQPFVNDAADGYDTVEWLAKQPWSNSKIMSWGTSYGGYNQWATLEESPPHLVAMSASAAAYPGYSFPMQKNIFSSENFQWLVETSGVTSNERMMEQPPFWADLMRSMYVNHRPFKDWDTTVTNTNTVFSTWLSHPSYDNFWRSLTPTPEHYAKITIPILTITGAYDGDQLGALKYYRDHMKFGTEAGRRWHFLIIGPWDHVGTSHPYKDFGGLKFGDASLIDLDEIHAQWYRFASCTGTQPEFLKKRVAYYVAGPGAEEWRYSDSLEAIPVKTRRLYLSSLDGTSNDVFSSGNLREDPPSDGKPDHYIYDPLDTRPGELALDAGDNYLTDQRSAYETFDSQLIYHSLAFPEPCEIVGAVKLSLWIAMDAPDTDFQAALYEITADGGSILLGSDVLRARYRNSLSEEILVRADEITRYDFDGFNWLARRISKGSRLRLIVGAINNPDSEKNYNSGAIVAMESGASSRVAHVALYHDLQHQSVLEVPIQEPSR